MQSRASISSLFSCDPERSRGISGGAPQAFLVSCDSTVYSCLILPDRTCIDMRVVQISYLIDYPRYIPQLVQWLFEEWDAILGEKTPDARIKKLNAHMNRDQLPLAWVAHANEQLLGTAALRVHDLEGREDLTPWLAGVFVPPQFRRRGIGAALCATVEEVARSHGGKDSLSFHTRQATVVFAPRLDTTCPVCLARATR